jgi:LysM repeat protein
MLISKLPKFLLLLAVFLLPACNFAPSPQGLASPTVEEVTITVGVETSTATASPTASLTPMPQVESPTPTFTPLPPSDTPTPTDTPGPYEHTIQEGETLGYIIQLYDYTDFGVIDEIVQLNGLFSADQLPSPGTVILIPRQTSTPTPEGLELTSVAMVQGGITPSPEGVQLPTNTTITQHVVKSGETIVGIAQQYQTTLEVLSQLNPEIGFFGCDFTNPSGGESCNVFISEGQPVNVPAPTPTPTLSPTPSGSETPTPTPTYVAPIAVYPPQGSVAPPGVFELQWVSVGILAENEYYLIEIEDVTNGSRYADITKDTSMLLPASLIPNDGQRHRINWTVSVATPNEQGAYRRISGNPEVRNFEWESP